MMKSIVWWIGVLGLISLHPDFVHAQQKILFLRLRMQGDSINLVESNVRSGILKRTRDLEKTAGITYEFRSSTGSLLWEGVLDDPSIRRYEFEDPMKPGQITSKEVRLKDVEFTVRAPFNEGMRYVEFYRSGFVTSSSGRLDSVRKLIGAIEVQQERGAQ